MVTEDPPESRADLAEVAITQERCGGPPADHRDPEPETSPDCLILPDPAPSAPPDEPSPDEPDPIVNQLLDAALSYAARGWPVFPLHSIRNGRCSCEEREERPCQDNPGKHPRVRHGSTEATTRPEIIQRWWRQWPDANICIRTGGNLAVLDIDVRDGIDGRTSLAALEANHGRPPHTKSAATGGGGLHRYFWKDGPLRSWYARESGLELHADNVYVVAPPGNHESGGTYTWLGPDELAPLPDWLATKPTMPSGNGTGETEPEPDPTVREGGRNVYLWQQACRMRRIGLSEDVILAALEAENQKCLPPWDGDLADLAHRAAQYAPADVPEADLGEGPPEGRFTRPISELLNAPDEPVDFLIRDILVAGSNGFVGGEPKSLKSWVALAIGLSLSTGHALFDRFPVALPRRVLYVQEEDNERRVRRRIRRLLAGCGWDSPTDEMFRYSVLAGLLLDDPAWIAKLREELELFRPALVICDVFENMHLQDSNDRKALKPVFRNMTLLSKEFGCGFLLVDHFSKQAVGKSRRGGQRLSGTTGKHAFAENSLYLYPTSEKNSARVETELKDAENGNFNLTLVGEASEPVHFEWKPGTDDQAAETKAKILETLTSEWMSTREVAEGAGVSGETAHRYLNLLKNEDHTVEKDHRQIGRSHSDVWRLKG